MYSLSLIKKMANRNKSSQPPPPPPPSTEKMDDAPVFPTVGKVGEGFQQLKLKEKDYVSEYFDADMIHRPGVILQYVNMNGVGATNMIGASRISVTDPRKVPAYLSRNKTVIRQHAVGILKGHFDDTQCSTGVNESLLHEDYSISFSWASISEEGRRLNPFGRNELPLAYAAFDNWIEPNHTHTSDPHSFVYVVNVWIMLQEPGKRKGAVLKRAREEEAQKETNAKKPKFQRKFEDRSEKDNNLMRAVVNIGEAVKRQAPCAPPFTDERSYPHLPVGAPPEWNKTGITSLPQE